MRASVSIGLFLLYGMEVKRLPVMIKESMTLADRASAGRLLGSLLGEYREDPNVVVVGLLRGGIPVACEVARQLCAPLDFIVVRKLGVPWRHELAMGAVATGGARVLDYALIREMKLSNYYVYGLVAREERELELREAFFRRACAPQSLAGRKVILVDDGAATGSTILAAKEAVDMQHPKEIVIALPVSSRGARNAFENRGSKCVCLSTPDPFVAVGQWYDSFPQLTDKEVETLLAAPRFKTADAGLFSRAAGGR